MPTSSPISSFSLSATDATVGVDQSAGALGADLAVVEVVVIDLGIRVEFGLLLAIALLEVLALQRLVGGRAESFTGRYFSGGE